MQCNHYQLTKEGKNPMNLGIFACDSWANFCLSNQGGDYVCLN